MEHLDARPRQWRMDTPQRAVALAWQCLSVDECVIRGRAYSLAGVAWDGATRTLVLRVRGRERE